MKLGSPSVWITAVTGAAILGVGLVQGARESPGPLTTVHGSLSELAGEQSCAACHGGWTTSMTTACLECHESVQSQLDHDHGFHGGLAGEQANACGTCHSEHHGPDFALVGEQSFSLAGFDGRAGFDHTHVGFPMDGAHLEQDCATCHEYADVAFLPDGAQRYGGLSRDCATCHEDPHAGSYVRACADCHTQTSFDVHIAVGHDAHLPLIGGHQDLACATCHEPDSAHALGAVTLLTGAPPARGCTDCHDEPHAGTFLRRVANQERTNVAGSCAMCHVAEHTSFLDPALTVTPRQHRASGFPLDAPHAETDCAACHGEPGSAPFAERFPGRTADGCIACHEDVHAGQFDGLAIAANGCVDCHERTHFLPHAFGLTEHARTALPLEGTHAEASCESCHVTDANDVRVFHGTATRCESCHADAHFAAFAGHDAELAAHEEGSCAACHQPTAFADVLGFDHARWTDFPVAGAHDQASCEACHPRADVADEVGRRFGRVEEHFGALAADVAHSCATCHADPHAGAFDGPDRPSEVDGRSGCARCHTDASFRALRTDFDHGSWTGFTLDGAHGTLGCATCHEPLRTPDITGRTWGRAIGTTCADCHSDPHGGQFTVDGAIDCARCHVAGFQFHTLAFDHDRDARFPLEGAHEQVACAACHPVEELPTGGTQVRYRPLDRECVDCHGVHREALRVRRRKK
ncbi:MAG: hypothetical protein AAF721_24605 [Myxococcota bacterium]